MKALFVINEIPSENRRAREGLRIAAGISPWGKVKPEVCFKKGIGQIKDPDIVRHLTLLIESGSKLYTMRSNEEKDLQPINKNELVKLEKNASIELRF